MRRSRARLLASAAVIATAGVASASIAIGVRNIYTRPGYYGEVVGGDGAMVPDAGFDDGPIGGFDTPMEGFDGPIEGFDGPTMDGMGPRTISIQEAMVDIMGPQGSPATGTATIYTNDIGTLGSAAIFSTDPSFRLTACGATSCNYGGQSVTPPYSLGIQCTPGSMQTFATLMVSEASGGFGSMTNVTCTSSSSGPILSVNPGSLNFGNVLVDQTPSMPITIANTGGGVLDNIVIDFGGSANADQWSASACSSGSPCSINGTGSMQVDITFAPTSHGVKNVTLTVTSNGGSDTVGLSGTGVGGVMNVKTPAGPSYILDIGTIPRGQPFSRNIELENLGNGPYTATTTTPAVPYTIAASPFTVNAGATVPIMVTCQSATASADDNPQDVTINSDAYLNNTATIGLRCTIANTVLQITPTMFDFGERRLNTTVPPIGITLTNPASSAGAAQITSFDLLMHKPGLTLTKPATPFSVAPGATENASLALSTAADTDLTGEYLAITVDGVNLMFPVTGKVVTPHSRVVPPNRLDLGSACVGNDITGNVMLINDGTATLLVDPPQMDQSFLASAMGTPGMLPAGEMRMAVVTPTASAMGSIEGTLTWHDDVPSNYEISVVLDYVVTGTALSPRGLDFGSVKVDDLPTSQRIKLQNCDMTPAKVKIDSLKTKQGTLGAWHIDPRIGYSKDLGGRENQTIDVTFEPPARGRYEADLTVSTPSGKQIVHLVGDATGRDWDNTSFYACACNGPGAPSRGWPIVLAIVVVIFRRRTPCHRPGRPER